MTTTARCATAPRIRPRHRRASNRMQRRQSPTRWRRLAEPPETGAASLGPGLFASLAELGYPAAYAYLEEKMHGGFSADDDDKEITCALSHWLFACSMLFRCSLRPMTSKLAAHS